MCRCGASNHGLSIRTVAFLPVSQDCETPHTSPNEWFAVHGFSVGADTAVQFAFVTAVVASLGASILLPMSTSSAVHRWGGVGSHQISFSLQFYISAVTLQKIGFVGRYGRRNSRQYPGELFFIGAAINREKKGSTQRNGCLIQHLRAFM